MLKVAVTLAICATLTSVSPADQSYLGETEVRNLTLATLFTVRVCSVEQSSSRSTTRMEDGD
jgi:hypothetical protein